MECKLNDPPRGHMHSHHRLDDTATPPLLPDKDQSSVIFDSQKDQ